MCVKPEASDAILLVENEAYLCLNCVVLIVMVDTIKTHVIRVGQIQTNGRMMDIQRQKRSQIF